MSFQFINDINICYESTKISTDHVEIFLDFMYLKQTCLINKYQILGDKTYENSRAEICFKIKKNILILKLIILKIYT